MTDRKELKTHNGYLLGEVISALQKEIRRGHEAEAMYWALELVPQYEYYFWRRLIVIANEDIGIANPHVLTIIPALAQSYNTLREAGRGDDTRLLIANAILLMCRSPKCRLADHFQCVIDSQRKSGELRLEIPDYALDKHTARGRAQGRGFEHWIANGTTLEPVSDIVDDYAEQAKTIWLSPEFETLPPTFWPKRGKKDSQPEQMSLLED